MRNFLEKQTKTLGKDNELWVLRLLTSSYVSIIGYICNVSQKRDT